MEETLELVSLRIRKWREEAKLTMSELASRSGVAASTIQKIESSQMVPSIAVLIKIAKGLGRGPGDFMAQDQQDLDVVHTREKEHAVVSLGRRMRVERLSADLFEPSIEVWKVHAQRGYESGDQHSYDGEEVIICEDGLLNFTVGSETFELASGDSLHFKAGIPHSWRNAGDTVARFLVIGNFPKALRAKLHRQAKRQGRRADS